MKRFALLTGLALLAAPAQADITSRIQSSVSLSVDGAGSVAIRQPSSMAVSGSNVSLDNVPTLGAHTSGTALGYTPGAFTVTTPGDSFTYSESFIEGDNVPSVLSTTVTSGVVPELPTFGNTTTTHGGVADTLAGSISTDGGSLSITAGGPGTTAIGQVIQELTIK